MDKLNSALFEIVDKYFGEQNEEVDEDDLDCIRDELESLNELKLINKIDNFKLAQISVKLGKPQILEFLVDDNEFTPSQLKTLYNLVLGYEQDNLGSESDSDSEYEDIEDIIKSFKKILRTPQGYRRKKN